MHVISRNFRESAPRGPVSLFLKNAPLNAPLRLAKILLCSLPLIGVAVGCETDGFIDPSRTGYFETTPTSIPILTRIDVIEQAADTSIEYTVPTPEDLVPNQLEYRLSPGDVVRVSIPQLISPQETDVSQRVIDQAGKISLPVIGRVLAAGVTVADLEATITGMLKNVITNPKVSISVEEARAYQFRVLGSVEAPGLFGLNKPDLRVLDALAMARGASPSTTRILVTRAKANASQYESSFGGGAENATQEPAVPAPPTQPQGTSPVVAPAIPPEADIDALINELPGGTPASPPESSKASVPAATPAAEPLAEPATPPAAEPSTEPATPPAAEPSTEPATPPAAEPTTEPATPPAAEPPATPTAAGEFGMLSSSNRQAPPVDIDQLEPATSSDSAAGKSLEAIQEEGDRYTFDNATQSYVRVGRNGSSKPTDSLQDDPTAPSGSDTATTEGSANGTPGLKTGEEARARGRAKREEKKAFSSRVIEVDYNQLVRGAANLNVIIRPEDMLYCDTGEVGVVYIGGEISRPGVYSLPTSGKLTLSRLVDAAGGLSQIAIPQRVDLIRRIGSDKEACIRVNLAAIRNRAEPDIFMKADDHVIIGTNFWATPLAVIRNGFRMTYGFGFLIDRNWGNDIFGAPPTNVVGQ